MSFDNIPAELKALPQWIVWRYENDGSAKPTKIPYCPQTGQLASVTEPQTWSNFDAALKATTAGSYSGIGFVFTANDPYAFIDLDETAGDNAALERQQRVFREFDSYSEVSPSGKGLHIIIRGAISSGRRRAHIEIYSQLRYATFTGIVHNNKPIAERQELLTLLWNQMGEGRNAVASNYVGDPEQRLADNEVLQRARLAANGVKFQALEAVDGWKHHYQSQSEADFAFVDIIAFYTQNREQISRLFLQSSLGQRKKAKRRDYVEMMINRSFDRQLPPVDIDVSRNVLDEFIAKRSAAQWTANDENQTEMFGPSLASVIRHAPVDRLPAGLLGEVARFIYEASPRPVREVAIAGAIGLLAGITGRAYTISGTGLNQYVLLLAMTGTGKEAIPINAEKLLQAIRTAVPAAQDFIGPAEIASGQALVKHMSRSPCFVSILGEFGIRLQQLSSAKASPAELQLRRVLLDLYNKSGPSGVLRPSIYSDKDKNTESVVSPSFTICGESTPGRFYENLDEGMIAEGLLSRFLIIEYMGPRPDLHEDHAKIQPSLPLVEKLATLCAYVLTLMHQQQFLPVQLDEVSQKIFRDYEKYTTEQINNSDKDLIRQLWNRAHIKALKLAALIAVGNDFYKPTINEDAAKWALDLVTHDVRNMLLRFREGAVGKTHSETAQFKEVQRIIKEYIAEPYNKAYGTPRNLHDAHIIPAAYIARKLAATAAFRLDRVGATVAIKRAIYHFLEAGDIIEVPRNELLQKYGTAPKSYIVANTTLIS